MIAGTTALLLTLRGMLVRKGIDPTDVYVLSYLCIMFGWPYMDSRFWLPVIPILLAYWMIGFNHKIKAWRGFLARCFICWYFLTGLSALVYSSRISLSADRFPDRYGDGNLRSTYCIFLGACDEKFVRNEHTKELMLLRVFSQRQ
jgi:hypothetical protein